MIAIYGPAQAGEPHKSHGSAELQSYESPQRPPIAVCCHCWWEAMQVTGKAGRGGPGWGDAVSEECRWTNTPPEVQGWSKAQMSIIPCQCCSRVSNLSMQSLSPENCLNVPSFTPVNASTSEQSKKQLKLEGKSGCETHINGSSVCKESLLGGANAPGLGLCSKDNPCNHSTPELSDSE